jgi:hypothetical protein
MTRRRIMLVEVEPRVPQPTVYSTWDPTNTDSEITLSAGNTLATRNSVHASTWRGSIATGWNAIPQTGMRSGVWYWETTPNYSGSADFSVGLSNGDDGKVSRLGDGWIIGSPFSVGISKNGDVRVFNSVQANIGAIASGSVIRHWLDLDSYSYKVAVNGGPWHDLRMTAPGLGMPAVGSPLIIATFSSDGIEQAGSHNYPATSLLRPSGTTASVLANFGATPFAYPPPPGANAGVFETADPVPTPLYFSSAPFSRVDKGTGIQYSARIVGDVEGARAGSCWVWGGQTESRRGSIQLVNVEGDLDHMAHWHWRDTPVRILQGYEGDAYGDFTLWAACVADNLVFSARSPRRAELVLADALAAADEPIQQETYPEDHPITADAGKPIPLVFGIPFGCSGALQSPFTVGADAFAWQIHDGLAPTLAGLGTIYDNGIDITSRCVQWPASAPYKGFRVTGMAPIGKVTVDASGNASTTIQTIVQNAFARLPPGKLDPMPAITLQPGGVAGLDSWAGIYIRESRSILQVLREAMDSVCGWACPTRDGSQLRLARVREPNGETPALVLTRAQIVGELAVELDTARNLTTRLAGRRNYTPHSHSEIAASISDPNSPAFDANRVAELTAEWRVIREGIPQIVDGAALSDAYAQARTAAHRGTLLQQQHHIQAEANRVCTTWYPTRHFVRLTALLDAVAADTLEPGDFVQLVWPGYGLEDGAMFMVVSVRSRFFSRRVDLTLWGSLPRET